MDFKLNREDKDSSSPSRSPLANSTSAMSSSTSSLSNSPNAGNNSGPHSPIGSIPKNFRAIRMYPFAHWRIKLIGKC